MNDIEKRKESVAWCKDCECYFPLQELKGGCACCNKKLVIRKGYICKQCEEQNIFFSLKSFKGHHAYD